MRASNHGAQPSRRGWVGRGLLVSTLAAVAACAWGAWSYAELARLEVELADAGARVRTASLLRLELVQNLLDVSSTGGAQPTAVASVERARARAAELLARATGDPGLWDELAVAHAELSTALATLRREPALHADALDELEPRLRRIAAWVDEGLASVERSARAYRRARERFPGSVVASLMG
jgi:hypothetical protein